MPHGQLRWPPPRQPRGQGAWTERGRASSHHRPSPPLPFARGPHFSFRPHSGNLLGAGPQHPKLFHHKGLRSLPEAPASLGARGRTEGARRPLGSGLRPVSSGSRRPGPPQQTPSPRPPAGKPAPAHLAPRKRRLLPDLRARAVCPSESVPPPRRGAEPCPSLESGPVLTPLENPARSPGRSWEHWPSLRVPRPATLGNRGAARFLFPSLCGNLHVEGAG